MNIKRFYKNELPNINDIVVVKIMKEDQYGYFGSLIEYNNIEGFLSLSEIVKGKYIKKHLLKENQILPLIVIKIDEKKKVIDLSKKRLEKEEEKYVLLKYKTCNNINKFINECYVMYLKYCDISSSDIIYTMNDIMNETVWKLYEEKKDKNDYTIILKNILENPKMILKKNLFSDEFIDKAINNINNRIIKKNMVLETTLSLMIFEENALQKIKTILINYICVDGYKINIYIVSPPLYKIRIEGYSKEKGYEIFNEIKENITEKTKVYSGTIKFEETKLISDTTYEIKFLGDFDLEKLTLK